MILGLDLSTKLVGCAILDKTEVTTTKYGDSEIVRQKRKLLSTTLWDVGDKKEFPDSYIKAEAIASELYQLSQAPQNKRISHIYVEDYVRGVGGRFVAHNMNVLLDLARFNGLICWNCYQIFGIKPILVNAASARANYGISFPRGTKGVARKKLIVQNVIEKEGDKFEWSYNRNGVNYSKGVDDRADAVVTARFGEFLERNKDNEGILTAKMKIDNLKSI
jgi:hypothetical protein